MTYDRWKTADDTPEDDAPTVQDELDLVYERLDACIENAKRLRASRDRLLAAAKATAFWLQKTPLSPTLGTSLNELQAAIAAAEERAP